VVDADGRVTHFVALQRELPEQRESGIEEKAQLFESVMEGTLDGLGVLEEVRDGKGSITDFRIRFMNQRMSEITQTPLYKLIGYQLLEKFPGVKEEGLFDAYCQVMHTGQPFDTERRLPAFE